MGGVPYRNRAVQVMEMLRGKLGLGLGIPNISIFKKLLTSLEWEGN